MDVCLCLEFWLQVVKDNGKEKSQAKEIRFRVFILKRKKGEMLWDNALVHCKYLSLILV